MSRTPLYAAAIAAIAAFACGPDAVRLDSSAISFDAAFFITLDAQGEVVRTSEVFGVDRGTISYGHASIRLEDGEERAAIVALDDELIQSTAPGFIAADRSMLALAHDPSFVEDGRATVRSPAKTLVPGGARWFDVQLEGSVLTPRSDLVPDLVLSIPNDPEFCAKNTPQRLHPVTRTSPYIPEHTSFPGYDEDEPDDGRVLAIHPLDGVRFLVATPHVLMLVHRDGEFQLPERFDLFPAQLVATATIAKPLTVSGVAIVPPGADGKITVWAVGWTTIGGGRVLELSLDDRGLTPIGTATQTPVRLHNAIADPAGNLIVVGNGGLILLKKSGSSIFERVQAGTMLDAVSITHTPLTGTPYLIGLKAQSVILGDVLRGALQAVEPVIDNALSSQNKDVKGVASAPDSGELWAVGELALVSRYRDRTWSAIDLPLPPSLGLCTAGDRISRWGHTLNAVLADPEFAYIASEECNALLRIERRNLCVTPVPRDGRDAESSGDDFWSVAQYGTRVFAGGTHGTIFEVN